MWPNEHCKDPTHCFGSLLCHDCFQFGPTYLSTSISPSVRASPPIHQCFIQTAVSGAESNSLPDDIQQTFFHSKLNNHVQEHERCWISLQPVGDLFVYLTSGYFVLIHRAQLHFYLFFLYIKRIHYKHKEGKVEESINTLINSVKVMLLLERPWRSNYIS